MLRAWRKKTQKPEMALAHQLAAILKENLLKLEGEGGSIYLRERSAEMCVRVPPLPAPVAVIRIDGVAHLPGLREGPWTRICDYLLVFETGNVSHAVFVELKKTWRDEQKPREQLRRSLPILEYLRSACRIEYGPASSESPVKVSYLLVCEKGSTRLDKQPVRADPAARIREETYEDITIRTFIGTPLPLAALALG